MIDPCDNEHWGKPDGRTKVGMTVFYQQPHMKRPEYGTIVSIQSCPRYVHVLFVGETTAKACRPKDLYFPPDYCAADRVNPPGQRFSRPEEMP